MSLKEYVKIAVGLREHPKVLKAGDEGGWLYVCAIMWSKEHDTDGFIPEYAVTRLTGLKAPAKALERCVAAGLFEVADGGWSIHDYLEVQESSERRKAAGRKAAAVRWERERAKQAASDSHANRNADRNANAMRDRNTEEEEEEETPLTPDGGDVVRFDRKPVPPARLALAERVLAEFNQQASTNYSAFTGRGRPSEDLRRIIGALTDAVPQLEFDEAQRMIELALRDPYWDGKPHTGVVFGPKVIGRYREQVKAPSHRSAGFDAQSFVRSVNTPGGAAA